MTDTDRDPTIGVDQADAVDRNVTYLLRNIPRPLWLRAKNKARQDLGGRSMRVLIIDWLRDFVDGTGGKR
jgi:hypothetical protein